MQLFGQKRTGEVKNTGNAIYRVILQDIHCEEDDRWKSWRRSRTVQSWPFTTLFGPYNGNEQFGPDVAFREAVLSSFVLELHETSHVEGTKNSQKVMPPPPLEIFAGLPPQVRFCVRSHQQPFRKFSHYFVNPRGMSKVGSKDGGLCHLCTAVPLHIFAHIGDPWGPLPQSHLEHLTNSGQVQMHLLNWI